MNFCIDCGKEVSYGPRCRSCAQKHKWKTNFSDKEKAEMTKFFEDGIGLIKIGKIFNYSYSTIRRTLIDFLGKEKYQEIAKEHSREGSKKGAEASAKLPRSKKQIKASQENVKKMQKAGAEACAKGIWISNPEHRFFLMCLTKMFFLKDIERQYYLKGLNHSFDFAIPKFKLLFEIDGDYWHSQNPERDVKIDKVAKSEGWAVIRFDDAKMRKLGII